MALHLPILPDRPDLPPCAGCSVPCCRRHQVSLDGHDLHRLLRGRAERWRELLELAAAPATADGAFRLDGSEARHRFLLRRRPGGACGLLLEDGSGPARCGAYEVRPAACRLYPLIAAEDEPTGSFVYGMAYCPQENKLRFSLLRPSLRSLLEQDRTEQELGEVVCARWNAQALRDGGAQEDAAAQLLRWLLALYEALAPLRAGQVGDPAGFLRSAAQLVRSFPLPLAAP